MNHRNTNPTNSETYLSPHYPLLRWVVRHRLASSLEGQNQCSPYLKHHLKEKHLNYFKVRKQRKMRRLHIVKNIVKNSNRQNVMPNIYK